MKREGILNAFFYVAVSLTLLVPFAIMAKAYPPGTQPKAPDGVEGLGIGIIVFVISVFLYTYFSTQSNRLRGIEPSSDKGCRMNSKNVYVHSIGLSIVYLLGSLVATYKGEFEMSLQSLNVSWASFSVLIMQASLVGMIYELKERQVKPDLHKYSASKLEYYVNNWRQFTQIFLTVSTAIGIGAFLQIYSSNFVNARHIFLLFAPLMAGILLCLMLLRKRILEISSHL